MGARGQGPWSVHDTSVTVTEVYQGRLLSGSGWPNCIIIQAWNTKKIKLKGLPYMFAIS